MPISQRDQPPSAEGRSRAAATNGGIAYALAAYGFWGLVPLYWHRLSFIRPAELIAHRVLWGLAAFVGLVAWRNKTADVRNALANPVVRLSMLASGLVLAINWATFVYAVATARLMQSSLGYFMNPLVSVLLGVVVLGERLRRWQVVAVLLALVGVVQLSMAGGAEGVPWIAFILAGSFGLYGLLRKVARVEALAGSAVETLLIAPLAAGYLVYVAATGHDAFSGVGLGRKLLIASTGPVTAVPLVWFATAARRLPLATMGFLQYIGPGLQLAIAVLIFGERFTRAHAWAFGLIWAGLAVYSIEMYATGRRRRGAGRL